MIKLMVFIVLSFSYICAAAPEYTIKNGRMYDKQGLPVETIARAALKLNTTRDILVELTLEKADNYEHISQVAYPRSREQYEKSKIILLAQLLNRK